MASPTFETFVRIVGQAVRGFLGDSSLVGVLALATLGKDGMRRGCAYMGKKEKEEGKGSHDGTLDSAGGLFFLQLFFIAGSRLFWSILGSCGKHRTKFREQSK